MRATELLLALAWLAVLAPAATADTVGVPIASAGVGVFRGVACPTATQCYAVGDNVLVPITDGIPGAAIAIPGTFELGGITCESATRCIAGGTNAASPPVPVVVPITDGIPGAAITDPSGIGIAGVACESATSCIAVGSDASGVAVVVPIAGTTFGTPVSVPGIGFSAIACQTATSCTAVGADALASPPNFFPAGVVVPITNGTPGAPITVPETSPGGGIAVPPATVVEPTAIACQTAMRCTAIGIDDRNFGVVVPITDGTPGIPIKPVGLPDPDSRLTIPAQLYGIACQGATTCEAVGSTFDNAVVVPIRNGEPGPGIAAPGFFAHPSLNAVACGSATSCEAVGTSGYNGLVVAACTPAAAQGCAALSGHASSHGPNVADRVTCSGSSGQTCVISEQLTITGERLVATKRLTINAGRTDAVTLKLNGKGKRLVRKLRELPVTLTISQAQGGGAFLILDRSLTVTR